MSPSPQGNTRRPGQGRRLVGWLSAAVLGLGAALAALGADDAGAPAVQPWQRPLSQRTPLVVGAPNDSYPYTFRTEKGESDGYAAEVLDAVARVMSLPLRRETASNAELTRRFRAGDFDVMQWLSRTALREEYADFTVPILTLAPAIYVRADGPVSRLGDLHGRKFAIIGEGSVAEQFLRAHQLQVEIVRVSSVSEGLARVERGECAATMLAQLSAVSVIDRLGLQRVQMLGEPLEDYEIYHCFAVHKGDAVLLARLNEGLAILQRTHEMDRIYRKWFGRYQPRVLGYAQVVTGGLMLAVLVLLAMTGAYWRQRRLHQQIARQTATLADQEALLRALYDNLPFMMCVVEGAPEELRLLSMNKQAEPYLGCSAREAVGRRLRELPLEPEWGRHLQDLWRKTPTHAGFVREERGLSSARKRLVFTLLSLPAGAGGVARTCLLVEDVTERRALDDEIAQSRKLRAVGELVGGIAHEFNNLLTPIMLKTSSIRQSCAHDAVLSEECTLILAAVQRAAELTRRLLAFGRKAEIRIESVRLAVAVENCFALMRLTLDRRIQWKLQIPPELPALHLNITDLNQVLANLVLNARDTLLDKLALQPDGWTPTITIEVRAEPAGLIQPVTEGGTRRTIVGWQKLTVRDNGMGMSREVRERVFEPFYTTKDVGKGTGLGLATVWHLVQETGGRVEVESAEGKGSAFHLWLPVCAPPPAQAPGQVLNNDGTRRLARIFLADDDDLVARTVASELQKAGHTVHRVADGLAAWNFLREMHRSFELLILDINMPGLDGIELAQRVRTTLFYSGKIMIVSGRLNSNDLRAIAQARVDAMLTKPFESRDFLEAVQTCLIGRPAGEK